MVEMGGQIISIFSVLLLLKVMSGMLHSTNYCIGDGYSAKRKGEQNGDDKTQWPIEKIR